MIEELLGTGPPSSVSIHFRQITNKGESSCNNSFECFCRRLRAGWSDLRKTAFLGTATL